MYAKKTLLELSKSVRFKERQLPNTRRGAMTFGREDERSEETSKETALRHRHQPSMDLIRQLPSRNRDGERSKSSTLHGRSGSQKRKNSVKAVITGGTAPSGWASSDEQLANQIYEAIRDEIDDGNDVVDAEQYGTTLLRGMKHSLQVKRKVKAKLVTLQNNESKRIGFHKRLWYSIAMMWIRVINSFRELGQQMELWHSHIHRIEGIFGNSVVSYFYFLRYLFYLNLLLAFLVGTFIFVPQELYRHLQVHMPYPNISFTGQELITGTGWFAKSELYYSGYTNNTIELFHGFYYHMPEAYLLTSAAYTIITLIVLAYSLASSYKKNFLLTSESVSRSLPIKVFCGWDHQIASQNAADLKQKAIYNELTIIVSKLKKDVVPDDCCVKFGHFMMRVGINISLSIIIAATGLLVYYLLESKSLKAEIPIFGEMVLALTITIVILLFPLICSEMTEWEDYKSKQTALYLTLIRTFVMQVMILGMLTYFWLQFSTDEYESGCWEAKLGQEMYRLVVVYLILILILTFLSDWVRKMIAKCFPSVGRAEFNIAANTLNLIYIQTLCWLGTFFCPLLPVIVTIVLVILFYVKRYSTAWNCQPSSKPWKASHARTIFLSLTLLSFLLTIIAICYTILMVHPSVKCGPFCHRESMYSVVLDILHTLISIQILGYIFQILCTPAVVGGVLILMSIFVYYLSAMTRAHKEMTVLLRKQLILESKDKVFLLRWFESTLKAGPKAPAENVQLHHVNETKAGSSGLKNIPGIGAIASGVGQVASGMSGVGSKVGQSVLKLTNVMNPIYRDKSRKDQQVKADPTDIPPIKTATPAKNPDNNVEAATGVDETEVKAPTALPSPPVKQHQNAWDKLRQISPPGSMTPDQHKMRGAFSRKSTPK